MQFLQFFLGMGHSCNNVSCPVNSRKMASASSRAGLTSEIDLYMVNGQFILADMPGYGFGDGSVRLNERLVTLPARLVRMPEAKTGHDSPGCDGL